MRDLSPRQEQAIGGALAFFVLVFGLALLALGYSLGETAARHRTVPVACESNIDSVVVAPRYQPRGAP